MYLLMMHGNLSRITDFGEAKELAEGFKDDNPLQTSDNYEVYMDDVEKQKDVVAFAEGLEGVRKVE